jgi:hypothetical protein
MKESVKSGGTGFRVQGRKNSSRRDAKDAERKRRFLFGNVT